MKFSELPKTAGDLPLFRTSLLLAGDRDPADVRRQLARWTASGKVVQLRRGVYVVAPPLRPASEASFAERKSMAGSLRTSASRMV